MSMSLCVLWLVACISLGCCIDYGCWLGGLVCGSRNKNGCVFVHNQWMVCDRLMVGGGRLVASYGKCSLLFLCGVAILCGMFCVRCCVTSFCVMLYECEAMLNRNANPKFRVL